MSEIKNKDPLHGVTLEKILTDLEAWYSWQELGIYIDIRCFNYDPSVSSSLKFLRKTPWARKKVEAFYLKALARRDKESKKWKAKDKEAVLSFEC